MLPVFSVNQAIVRKLLSSLCYIRVVISKSAHPSIVVVILFHIYHIRGNKYLLVF